MIFTQTFVGACYKITREALLWENSATSAKSFVSAVSLLTSARSNTLRKASKDTDDDGLISPVSLLSD